MEVLPEEIVAYILSLLDERTLRDVVPYVCFEWAVLASKRGVWKNICMSFDATEEADFAERSRLIPPAVHTIVLAKAHEFSERSWSVVTKNASNVRRLFGLTGEPAHVVRLLRTCRHTLEELSVHVDLAHSQEFLWDQFACMPRLRRLKLSSDGTDWTWTCPSLLYGEWPQLERLDISELRSPSKATTTLLQHTLQLRNQCISAVFLSYDTPLTTRLMRQLQKCPNLRELGIHCDSDLSRVDNLRSIQAMTLIGCSHRGTREWFRHSSLMPNITSLTFDNLREQGSLYNILPVVASVCKRLKKITFKRSQLDARFPRLLKCLPLVELHCENLRADQVHEMLHLPKLAYLRVWGHLGNYKTMMDAVTKLRTAKPSLKVAGLEDCLFNHWGKNANRAFL